MALYKAWGKVHVVDIIMDKSTNRYNAGRQSDSCTTMSSTMSILLQLPCNTLHKHYTTYTLHTCFIVVFLELLDVCIFLHCLLLKVLYLIETWVNFCWGRRRESQGWQKHFSFGQAKYSAGIMHLCRGCEAVDYLCKALTTFDVILVCWVQNTHL